MNMGNLNKLALTAQEALQQTLSIASDAQASQAEPIHMLKALLESKENNLSAIIKRIGADPAAMRASVDAHIESMPKVSGGNAPFGMSGIPSQALMSLLDSAVKIAEKLGDSYATSEHLLIALSEDKGEAGRILNSAGVTRKNIEAAYEELRGDTRVTDPQEKAQFEALERYGQQPHPAGPRGQARPGDRPFGGDPPHHPGAQPPHQEQPGAHRRARRRQDRHRRGPGPAHRRGRRPVQPEGSRDRLARHGLHAGGRQVPRRVRGPLEGRAARGEGKRRAHHPVHRRVAHHRRRRFVGRQLHRRRQHAQARARPRRAARHRRHHARRVPQVHREGRRARAPLPAGGRRRADGGRHHRHPARPEGEVRDPPRRPHHRCRHRRRGGAVEPLHLRPFPARQGDRLDGRGGQPPAHRDRLHARGGRPGRAQAHPDADRGAGADEGERRGQQGAPRGAAPRHRSRQGGARRPQG